MTNSQTDTPSVSQSEKFSLEESFKVLLDCRDREELIKAVKEHIYPAFEDDFRHFVIEVSETEPPPLLGCSGLSGRDQQLIRTYLAEDSLSKLMLLHNEVSEQIFLRDENHAQTLFSFLGFKIKSVMLEEDLVKTQAMVQGLMKSPSGIAVVNSDRKVIASNPAFRDSFDIVHGVELPQSLVNVLEREQANLGTPDSENTGKWGKEVSFFTLPKGTYKLYLMPLEAPDLRETGLWLLRIHPAADPFTKSNQLIEKAGLTWREMEICCLIHDGLGRTEIAERLFISAHTVKTHLKKIHKKLEVNSRTQLVAYLNQHADETHDGGFG